MPRARRAPCVAFLHATASRLAVPQLRCATGGPLDAPVMPPVGRARPTSSRAAVVRGVGVLLGTVAAAFVLASCDAEFTAPRVDHAPQATMSAPLEGATFSAGDTIAYEGAGTDHEDGTVPVSRMAWWVELRRGSESQVLVPRTAGVSGGTIVVPTRG